METYRAALLAALQDAEKAECAIEGLREKVRSEITFSSIVTEIPLSPVDTAPVVEHILMEVDGFPAYEALLTNALDRVSTYGTLEIVSLLGKILNTQREIADLLKKK